MSPTGEPSAKWVYVKSWKARNPEKAAAAQKAWKSRNPEKIAAAKQRARARNPEKFAERARHWKTCNPEKYAAGMEKWRNANQEKVAAVNKRRSDNVTDGYVTDLIRKSSPELVGVALPQELIEAKREQILMLRATKQLNQALKELTT